MRSQTWLSDVGILEFEDELKIFSFNSYSFTWESILEVCFYVELIFEPNNQLELLAFLFDPFIFFDDEIFDWEFDPETSLFFIYLAISFPDSTEELFSL